MVPRLAGTAAEIDQVLAALDGRFIEAGPSGSPLRGLVNVLPTGRNFYSVDVRNLPTVASAGSEDDDGDVAATEELLRGQGARVSPRPERRSWR